MVDMEKTDLTPKGMSDNMTEGHNGKCGMNDIQIWMEHYDMIQGDVNVTCRGCSE